MNCFQFGGLVHDLGRNKRLGAEVRAEALAHAESCVPCGRMREEVERLDAALKSLATEQSVERAQGRVEAALVAEFLAVRNGAASAKRRSALWQAAAVAAVVTLLATAGWTLRHFAHGAAGTLPATDVSRSVGGHADTVTAENENDDRFVRLPFAGDGKAVEDDAILRAELPGSALASLGFPVGDVNGTEMVPVELMVGEDGTPEAIRIVPQEVEE